MMKKLNCILWYLFFAVYWTAHELGEKDHPQENAKYYMIMTIGLNVFGLYEIFLFYGYSLNAYLVAFSCAAIGTIITNRLFFRKNFFASKFIDFNYLKKREYRFKRYKMMIFVALWSMLFVTFGAIIRMK